MTTPNNGMVGAGRIVIFAEFDGVMHAVEGHGSVEIRCNAETDRWSWPPRLIRHYSAVADLGDHIVMYRKNAPERDATAPAELPEAPHLFKDAEGYTSPVTKENQ